MGSNRLLTGLSAALLGAALIFLAGVVERWGSAAWMAFKFLGTPVDGFVNLGFQSALIYVSMGLALTLVSRLTFSAARRRNIAIACALSKYASVGFAGALVLYVVLGFSPLNHWRP